MLVETKARVGVFAIALGAYLPQFPSLVPEFQSQYQTFKTMIPDSVELIDGGIVTEQGTPDQIFGHPQHARTREFLSKVL